MLAKTHEYSSRRILGGVAVVAMVGIGALGLTASGTAVASRITEEMTSATGIALDQDMPVPPVPPVPPAAPSAPNAPAVPGAPEVPQPPAPPAAPQLGAEAGHQQVHRVRIIKDGRQVEKVTTKYSDDTEHVMIMPDWSKMRVDIPEVVDGKCGKADQPGETVVHRQEGGRKRMIICTDRIEAMSENATRMAMHGKRMGLHGARMGIEFARRAVEADRNLSAAERTKALKELDEAMAEIAKDVTGDD